MSDHYVFSFAFELRAGIDDRIVRVFEALARGEAPRSPDLAALPKALIGMFESIDALRGHRSVTGSPVTLWSRELRMSDGRPHLQRHLRLSLVMHDDWYADGGWVLPFALFDLVGESGFFGQHRTDEGRGLTHYYRRDADLAVVEIAVSDRSGEPFAVTVGSTTIVSAAERAEFLAQADGVWPSA